MFLGSHLLKQWSKTQAGISLSSGEAELYAIVKGSCEGIGMQRILQEFGVKCSLTVATDSAAARGTVMRSGAGRLKHVALNSLWVQEQAAIGRITYEKIPRSDNVADLLTHHWSHMEGQRHIENMHVSVESDPSGLNHLSGEVGNKCGIRTCLCEGTVGSRFSSRYAQFCSHALGVRVRGGAFVHSAPSQV